MSREIWPQNGLHSQGQMLKLNNVRFFKSRPKKTTRVIDQLLANQHVFFLQTVGSESKKIANVYLAAEARIPIGRQLI